MTLPVLKIGTRGSPLALRQTAMVEEALRAARPGLVIERIVIRTSGDWKPEQGETRLSEVDGGKGLFVREIERCLLAGDIDCAVHSLKDMPSFLPDGLVLDHMLVRGNPCDVFVSHKASSLEGLPHGAVVGTSSLRRQSFILAKRPDLKIVPLRGNVQTRLEKLKDGQVDATFLALAGLQRLGIDEACMHPLSPSEMVPACGQATIAIETRRGDEATRRLLNAIHHEETGLCSFAERAALQVLDGSCHTPIGAYARIENGQMALDLVVGSHDGKNMFAERGMQGVHGREAAEAFGRDLGTKLKSRAPADIFS